MNTQHIMYIPLLKTDFIPKLDLMDLPGREGKGRSHRELSLHQGGAKKTGQTAQTPNGELVMEDMEDMEVDCAPEMAVAVGRKETADSESWSCEDSDYQRF